MTSEASACLPCLSNGKESLLTHGGAAEKRGFDKPRWNTVRQGNVWINGLFHEQDVYLDNDSKAINGLSGGVMDRIANEIALQEVMTKESAASQSGPAARQQDYDGNERVFALGGEVEEVMSNNPRWNTLRQGNIWINGLFHEHDFYVIDDTKGIGDVTGFWENIDWIANKIAFQDAIPKEIAVSQSGIPDSTNQSTKQQVCDTGWQGFADCDLDTVTTAISRWEIWEPRLPSVDGSKRADTIRVPFSEDISYQRPWSAVEIGWQNVYSDLLKNRERQGLPNDFMEPAWSNEDSLIQEPRIPIEHDTGAIHFVDERKIIQELSAERRLQEEIQQEMLSERWWPVHSSGQRDGNALDIQQGNLNCMKEGKEAQVSILVATEDDNEAGSSAYLFKTPEVYDSGRKSGETDTPSSEGNCSADKITSSSIPHDAFLYIFSYLDWYSLLTVERVCKLFQEYVRGDALLWRRLHVEPPFSKKLTDERLLQLAARAKGQLQCLSLVDCFRVSENAVEQVVRSNPKLSKLCLPGCSRVTADAVLRIVKDLTDRKVAGVPDLKQLRIRNIYGLTREHLEILQSMLQKIPNETSIIKPQFYLNGHSSLPCSDQRPIDVEACPKCGNVRIVYDCTREKCQHKLGNKLQECRGCIFCIARCEECGRCINDNDYEETFCLDLLCSACWLRLPKCAECNRPGCGRHVDHFIRSPDMTFVCGDCCGFSGENGPEFHVLA